MEKFSKLNYQEIESRKVSDAESVFVVSHLERGFAHTLGNVLRRVLLSSIPGVSIFAVKIAGVIHEFQTIPGVTEDVVQLILNLRKVRFVHNENVFRDGEIIRVSLTSGPAGEVLAKDITLPAGVEVYNIGEYIATTAKDKALSLELFLMAGRGFVSFDDNRKQIKSLTAKINSKITVGSLIPVDSNFSPIQSVSYTSTELNSSSATIDEKLTLNIKTDGSVSAKQALAQAAEILVQHFSVIANVENIKREEIFMEKAVTEKMSAHTILSIAQLDLSVRSYNCLKRAGYETTDQLANITKEQLEQIKNLGKKSAEEIIDKLAHRGISLKGSELTEDGGSK